MKHLLAVILVFASNAALAQQSQSPTEQALGNKLMQEISSSLICSANLIAAQADLAKAQARIKELESKAEEKK